MKTTSAAPIKRISARKYRGLGDVVAAVAKPVARGLDAVLGSDVTHCAGCEARRQALNGWWRRLRRRR
jgi:hypothetical protein